jgi:hypothetical protein
MKDKSILAVVATVGIVFAATTRTWACQCSAQPVADKLASAKLAFRAKVMSSELIESTPETKGYFKFKIKILETYKGKTPQTMALRSGTKGGDCSTNLFVGSEELFFFNSPEPDWVHLCDFVPPDAKALQVLHGEIDDRNDPKDPTPLNEKRVSQQHYLSGVIFFQKGDYANARKEWTESLSHDPYNEDAKFGIERIDRIDSKRKELNGRGNR